MGTCFAAKCERQPRRTCLGTGRHGCRRGCRRGPQLLATCCAPPAACSSAAPPPPTHTASAPLLHCAAAARQRACLTGPYTDRESLLTDGSAAKSGLSPSTQQRPCSRTTNPARGRCACGQGVRLPATPPDGRRRQVGARLSQAGLQPTATVRCLQPVRWGTQAEAVSSQHERASWVGSRHAGMPAASRGLPHPRGGAGAHGARGPPHAPQGCVRWACRAG
jgi:hypothetical protein